MLLQAVVRGRKLRRHLSNAWQAATYTDASVQHEPHNSDLNMDQMDDFLASLPDDDPPQPQLGTPAPPSASTSSHVQSTTHHHITDLVHGLKHRLLPGALPETSPSGQASSSNLLQARRTSHAQAGSSLSHHPPTSASLSPVMWNPVVSGGLHAISIPEATAGSNLFHHHQQQQQQQQQGGIQLPALASLTPSASIAPSSWSADVSLPPIHTGSASVSAVPPASAALAAAGVADPSEGRSARVSRASSSVRSEQSASSPSPDKAAAKEQRHKVMPSVLLPSSCCAMSGQEGESWPGRMWLMSCCAYAVMACIALPLYDMAGWCLPCPNHTPCCYSLASSYSQGCCESTFVASPSKDCFLSMHVLSVLKMTRDIHKTSVMMCAHSLQQIRTVHWSSCTAISKQCFK